LSPSILVVGVVLGSDLVRGGGGENNAEWWWWWWQGIVAAVSRLVVVESPRICYQRVLVEYSRVFNLPAIPVQPNAER